MAGRENAGVAGVVAEVRIMTKLTRFLIVAVILGLLGGGAYAAWLLRNGPKPVSPERAEYDRFVARVGGDEPAVRNELNYLISTASAPLGPVDRGKANRLTRECLDPNALLEIDHVRAFIENSAPPYHFVGDVHREKLRAIAGDSPPAEKVLAVCKALAALGEEFRRIRQPPDWKVSVEVLQPGAEVPRMPFLDLLKSGSTFLPLGRHPDLRDEPRIPAFAAPDGELLVQLEQFFNTPQARAALPPDKFPKLYQNGHIPPIPTNLFDYQKDMEAAVAVEMRVLLPFDPPPKDGVENVNEVYGKLERFFTAVVQFEPK